MARKSQAKRPAGQNKKKMAGHGRPVGQARKRRVIGGPVGQARERHAMEGTT